jgi:putative DNA primase/helicase
VTTTRQIKVAKAYLEHTGKVRVELRQNGRRANPVHTLIKTSPINHYIRGDMSGERIWSIDWSLFDNFAAKDLNQMAVEDLLEIYAEIGFQTIPLHFPKFKGRVVYCSCIDRRNCPSIGKHPVFAYSELDFSNNRIRKAVQSFWDEDIRYNIGFRVEGFTVIDVDYRNGGHYSLGFLEEELGEIPASLSVRTGNGRHIYVKADGLPNSVEIMGLAGIDVRSTGGIVVAPYSVHESGNEYQWEAVGEPEPLPESWKEFLTREIETPARGRAAVKAITKPKGLLPTKLERGDVIPDGERNWTLFRLASRERGKGAGYEHIYGLLLELNGTHTEGKLKDSELRKIAKSVMRYPTETEKRLGRLK